MTEILKIAIMALGGQGGGVLSSWLTELALLHGYHVQTTSVAGVAQRTGATIYYTEMAQGGGPEPVMALAPSKGDVDILIAAEAMEAGRAVMRGFVTPDRTTLIASTHRAYATVEKTVPGDGRGDEAEVANATHIAAKRLIAFDMEAIAQAHGSVISASLLGALAGARVMPFERDAFEAVIKAGGRGIEPSLAAFHAAYETVDNPPDDAIDAKTKPVMQGSTAQMAIWQERTSRIQTLPDPVQAIAKAGLEAVVDFQDLDYGTLYLDRLARFLSVDRAEHGYRLAQEAAKYLANAMTYDDPIRVADRKTRPDRMARIEAEMGHDALAITDYLHPGAGEVIGLMPAKLGARLASSPKATARLDRLVNRGRHLQSNGLLGFTAFYLVSGLRRFRRSLYRHQIEEEHIQTWLNLALDHVPKNYALACEILACRRLIKGYADTHARGMSKFDRVLSSLPWLEGRSDADQWLRRLRQAALTDPEGKALDGALRTVQELSFDERSTAPAQ